MAMRCTHSVPAATFKSQVSFWPFWLPSAAQRESGEEEEEEVASSLFGGVLFLRLPPAARAPKIKPRLRPSLCILDGRRRLVLSSCLTREKKLWTSTWFFIFPGFFLFPLDTAGFPVSFLDKILGHFNILGLFFHVSTTPYCLVEQFFIRSDPRLFPYQYPLLLFECWDGEAQQQKGGEVMLTVWFISCTFSW